MTYALVSGSLPFAADDAGALQHQIKFSTQSYTGKVGAWAGGIRSARGLRGYMRRLLNVYLVHARPQSSIGHEDPCFFLYASSSTCKADETLGGGGVLTCIFALPISSSINVEYSREATLFYVMMNLFRVSYKR